ncbi:MAG: cell division protein FtsI [Lachnospiraceae bacterium]|nr:cell division protein FtsI [Lachnospiraceae bacterium]
MRRRKKASPEMALQGMIAKKAAVVAAFILLAFVFLVIRIAGIMRDNGEQYKKQVLAQQEYDSVTIPYQRGAITDRNGTLLAYSERVYNVILDNYLLNNDGDDGRSTEPTLTALGRCFSDVSVEDLRGFVRDNPDARYHIIKKNVSFDEMEAYKAYVEETNAAITEANKESELKSPKINDKAVWFEDQFRRMYPGGSLACDVIGFTTGDGQGQYGLEEYYNDQLTGTNGREYGYLLAENALERTVIPAKNGNTLVTTIDSYIQGVCEEKLKAYNEEHAGEFREGEMGSDNTGVIIMDIHSGEILAMASYPYFDLNNPKDLSMYSEDEVNYLIEREGDEEKASQYLWKNFCISQSYEPGSVCKTFTVAAALDAGAIHDGDSYDCRGYLTFGEGDHATTIRCHQRYGDGMIDVKTAVEKSCNVALMLIGQRLGKERFLEYQKNFNFGLRTNVDLAGEMRTSSLVFNSSNMGITELMTSTFGQGFNVTMIQTISAYCSLVNGGYYYQPHVVKQILDDSGAVVENIEPLVMRQVVSGSVSDLMKDYCIGVVEEGTGTRARPAGYKIGGKTGTAERSGQGKRDYTVSFMGFAPADDPQIAIYVVIDRPNAATQEFGTRYACLLCRDILTDVLPYLHIFMTEPLSDDEKKELEERGKRITVSENSIEDDEESVSVNEVTETEEGTGETEETPVVELNINPNTGVTVDPINGEELDPETGVPVDPDSGIFQDAGGNSIEIEVLHDDSSGDDDPRL